MLYSVESLDGSKAHSLLPVVALFKVAYLSINTEIQSRLFKRGVFRTFSWSDKEFGVQLTKCMASLSPNAV